MTTKMVMHYRISGVLGHGGMGEVYQAYDTKLGRPVALKFLSKSTADAATVRRFLREARAASALNHPNIVTVHDIGESEAGQFIVMEMIQGRTLRQVIQERKPGDPVLSWLVQATRALSAAHHAGIVHGDIKPENIMVRDDGYVKLLDFGLSRHTLLQDSATVTGSFSLDATGKFVGTIRYMSPEQARTEMIDPASDMFSLGIVFYEAVTGRHPFDADNVLAVLTAITTQRAIPPSLLNPEISQPLEDLILGMIEKDKARRPPAAEAEQRLDMIIAGKTGAATRPSAMPRRISVGRQTERRSLRDVFERVNSGQSLLVCISGEPGMGKTTLVEDFLHDLTADHVSSIQIGRGRCSERLEGTGAYLPFLEALEALLHSADSGSTVRAMKLLAPTWYTQLRTMSEESAGAAPPPATSLERLKRELVLFLQEATQLRPIVLFLDDLHWADASTVDLINYIASRFDSMRTLIIGTYRPVDLRLARHPMQQVQLDLQARGACIELGLEFLKKEDTIEYLAGEFPGHRFPGTFADLIHSKTEGNPLFMVDVVRYLRNRGTMAQESGHWALVQSVPDIERELPQSVRSMIQKKIDQISEADRKLLSVASVQGIQFDAAVLSDTLKMDAGDVEDRLQEIDRIHAFIRVVGEHEFPDGVFTLKYRFVHVLYQHAVNGLLTPTRRSSYSTAIAESLLRHHGRESMLIAAELALLFETGREFARATEHFLLAARNAARLFANREAATLASRGLATLSRLPDSPGRTREELTLRVTLGVALMSLKGYADPEVEAAYKKAADLCELLGESMDLFPVLWGLFTYYHVRAEMGPAMARADQLLRLAEDSHNSPALVQAHNAQAIGLLVMAKTEAALVHLDSATAIYEPAKHAANALLVGHDPGVLCRSYAGRALWYLGFPDRALHTVLEGLEIAKQRRHPYSLVFATGFVSFVQDLRRDFEAALNSAATAIRLASEEGFPVFGGLCGIVHGWAQVHLNGTPDGLEEMLKSIAALRHTGTEVTRSHNMTLLSDAYLRLENFQECLKIADETLEWSARTGVIDYDAELYRIKAAAVLSLGRDVPAVQDEAEDLLVRSTTVARTSNNRSWELRTSMDLAELWASRDRKQAARELLEGIYRQFNEGWETADLRRARRLLNNTLG